MAQVGAQVSVVPVVTPVVAYGTPLFFGHRAFVNTFNSFGFGFNRGIGVGFGRGFGFGVGPGVGLGGFGVGVGFGRGVGFVPGRQVIRSRTVIRR